ncbi:MAG: asparagine synthase (glutamine-hydrolyzing) [Candidatus Dadabacteria bacterium]|nr:MAG: asparagine synthase (glutamine-hydrolyzing) [Candidatus Dadabacteria bacterium]
MRAVVCGICGFVGSADRDLLAEMLERLAHRGPDDEGIFIDEQRRIGLGHRRLSIIDVSGGHQPMANERGDIVLVANGEVYNHHELRNLLERRGHRFRTRSDSEVILHLYEDEGPGCLEQLNGMFAFALYDRRKGTVFLARDRIGIKPLYYAAFPRVFLFASEIKALMALPGCDVAVRPEAVDAYLSLRYVPGPETLLRDVRSLPAGCYAVVSRDRRVYENRWWHPEVPAAPGRLTDDEYVEEFARRFETSIRRRLMSEVPLGVYLSGGIDSGAITAAVAGMTDVPVRTFSVGFGFEHDELAEAERLANTFSCRHTSVHCRLSDLGKLPEIVYHLDQPIGDPIVLPMFLLAETAKNSVTVVLAGEGADELLAGYLFFKVLARARAAATVLRRSILSSLVAGCIEAIPASLLNRAFDYPATLGTRGRTKVADFVRLLKNGDLAAQWRHLVSLFDDRDKAMLYTSDFAAEVASAGTEAQTTRSGASHVVDQLVRLQFAHWLPDDILMKQDRLSMAHGIEVRVPFLDHELVEWLLSVPPGLKQRGRQSKYLLRAYGRKILPPEVSARAKKPFYAPIENFVRDPAFRELVSDCLSDEAVRRRGMFDPAAIRDLRARAEEGEFLYVKQVFSLVMLELWFRRFVEHAGGIRAVAGPIGGG